MKINSPQLKLQQTKSAGPRILASLFSVTLGAQIVLSASAPDVFKPGQPELDKTTAFMSPRPLAMGPSVTNRAAWASVVSRPELRDVLQKAAEELRKPLPELTDELYLDYSKTGNRRRCEAVLSARRGRISLFTLAECLENRGRFLPPLEQVIRSIAQERSWTMPAHDGALDMFYGRAVAIDLAVAMLGWDLATADSLLGEKLSADTRALIRSELERRVFAPYHRMVAGEQGQYWLLFDHNWNAVCLAGVTGAALTIVDDAKERAWFVLAADKYSRNFLKGFTPDGYCNEGVGYWNYGFGHYVAMAEAVRRATRDAIDFLARKDAAMPAAYGTQIEIVGGVCPGFADCPVDAHPDPTLLAYLNRRLGLTVREIPSTANGWTHFYRTMMNLFPESAPTIATAQTLPQPGALRTWFADAGVLICRPGADAHGRMGVAILGGHNGEHHNHNDVGTFMVVVGREAVLPDIGAEVYTKRTFSGHRYDSEALNSFGHAVPVVAGRLQRTGRAAAAHVLKTEFKKDTDIVAFDIRSAYDVPSLQKLERTFVYSRPSGGSLAVTDEFAFSQPETFESALLTFGEWQQISPTVLRVKDRAEAIRVEMTSPTGAVLDVNAVEIHEDLVARRKATRIGLRLKEPLSQGKLTLKITPEPGQQ